MPKKIVKKIQVKFYKKIDVPFASAKEVKAFEDFLFKTGRVRGPWVRNLILAAIAPESEEAIQLRKELEGYKYPDIHNGMK